ncbi:hypothetical protein K439DRAFT_1661399 [Ramaria rubella]|nr:hypothetical protein K439DRAFT_1661399 [Ramaria rubella]
MSTVVFDSYRDIEGIFATDDDTESKPFGTNGTPTETRLTLTVLTGAESVPMSSVKAAIRRKLVEEFAGPAYVHPSLFEQCFGECQLDGISLAMESGLHSGARWKGVRSKYVGIGEEKVLAKDLFGIWTRLAEIWVARHPEEVARQNFLLDTQDILLPDDRDSSHFLRPDIFLRGSSSAFPRPLKTAGKPRWTFCAAVGDAKCTRGIPRDNKFGQLGTYAEQIFSAQDNRRFLLAFFYDDTYIKLYIFDRAGVITGSKSDYQKDPWKLCAIPLQLLFKFKDDGLDPSIRFKNGAKVIKTTPPPPQPSCDQIDGSASIPQEAYAVSKTLFHATDFLGSGVIYWLTKKLLPEGANNEAADAHEFSNSNGADHNLWHVLKDAWIVGGCEREREIYQKIRGFRENVTSQVETMPDVTPKGTIPQGVAPLIFTHDVYIGGKLDCISENRPNGILTPPEKDRVHTRAVFLATEDAKLLDHFSNPTELLVALRDAVEGHRRLFSRFILHSNITPAHILIQPNAKEGNRGILLNFDSAMDMDTPMFTLAAPVGCRAFYSCRAGYAAMKGTHYIQTYWDDLESFFHVFYYLTACYPAKGSLTPHIREDSLVRSWFSKNGGKSKKWQVILGIIPPDPVDPSFPSPISKLREGLLRLFKVHASISVSNETVSIPSPRDGYDEFLKLINTAIETLEKEAIGQIGFAPYIPGSAPTYEASDNSIVASTSTCHRSLDQFRDSAASDGLAANIGTHSSHGISSHMDPSGCLVRGYIPMEDSSEDSMNITGPPGPPDGNESNPDQDDQEGRVEKRKLGTISLSASKRSKLTVIEQCNRYTSNK